MLKYVKLQLVELTKLLEREICDSMTVTQPMLHNMDYDSVSVNYSYIGDAKSFTLNYAGAISYSTPKQFNNAMTVPIIKAKMKYGTQVQEEEKPLRLYVVAPDGTQTLLENVISYGDNPVISFTPTQIGNYGFKFCILNVTLSGYSENGDYFIYYIASWQNSISTEKTITQVVNRLLSSGVTRRSGLEAQKYIFDSTLATKYASVKAPEFFFTRSTLFEALLQVGAYIHAIPRLVVQEINGVETDVVKFDELGGDEVKEVTVPYVFQDIIYNEEDYCGEIDSHVDNLLNSRDLTQGAISEPSAQTAKTIRCEEAKTEISADNMVVLTESPIYQMIKCEVSYPKNGALATADITPYVYEAAEYDVLSSFWGSAYPYSKAFAVRYAQGDNKITGLNFKQNASTSVQTAYGKFAIRNIISAVDSGYDIGSGFNYTELAFRVTYIPIVSTRIVQRKPFALAPVGNAKIYNQTANTAESELYGEKLKGVIARLGQKVVRRTYDFINYVDIPKCGQKVDIDGTMMYVAMVEREFDLLRIRATITYTPNFNKLAEYIAIDSNFRLYDVSEKQSVDRYVNYGENIVISEGAVPTITSINAPMITSKGMATLLNVFKQQATIEDDSANSFNCVPITAAVSQGFSAAAPLQKCGRSVISFGSGNSLCFAYDYADNFGAGYQSSNAYENQEMKRVQKLVAYGDSYGELQTLSVNFVNQLWTQTLSAQTADNGASQLYPAYNDTPSASLIETGAYPLFINKDSRERLAVMAQLHFIGATENIVLGPMLGQNNPLVTSVNALKAAKCYVLFDELNMLRSTVDLSNAVEFPFVVYQPSATTGTVQVTTSNIGGGKSIAYVDATNNKLILGINKAINGTQTTLLNFKAYSNNAYKEAYAID